MPFTAGVYAAPSSPGAFNQAVDGQPATPAAWNALLADLTTALSTTVLKDGTQIITANIPMNSHKFTGMITGSVATDSATLGQVQTVAGSYASTVGGTGDAITLTVSPALTALTAGLRLVFTATASNTTATTINASGLGVRAVTWPNQDALVANDITINSLVEVGFNSATNTWQMMNVPAPVRQNIANTKGDLYVYNGSIATRLQSVAGSVLMGRTAASSGLAYGSAANEAIWGLTYQNAAGDVTNDLDLAAGGCMDATNAYWIGVAALTKQSDVNWAVGTGAGMLDTGTVGNSPYYLWAIARSDTGVTDILCSLSSTAPTMPANYDFKRLIGWFRRTGAAIILFKTYEAAGGALRYLWSSPTLDVNLANTLTTSRRTDAVNVPLNFSVDAILNVVISDVGSAAAARIYCPDQADVATGDATTAPLGNISIQTTGDAYAQLIIKTSAAGLIAARATLATVDQYSVSTEGFTWSRRP